MFIISFGQILCKTRLASAFIKRKGLHTAYPALSRRTVVPPRDRTAMRAFEGGQTRNKMSKRTPLLAPSAAWNRHTDFRLAISTCGCHRSLQILMAMRQDSDVRGDSPVDGALWTRGFRPHMNDYRSSTSIALGSSNRFLTLSAHLAHSAPSTTR